MKHNMFDVDNKESEHLTEEFIAQQLMINELGYIDAITKNAIGSAVANFKVEVNQLKNDYLSESCNEIVEPTTKDLERKNQEINISEIDIEESLKTAYSTDSIIHQMLGISNKKDISEIFADELAKLFNKCVYTIKTIVEAIKETITSIRKISPFSQYTHFIEKNLLKQQLHYKLNTTRP